MRNAEKTMIEEIRLSYSELMPHQPQFFVNRQAFVFENGRTYLLAFLEGKRRSLKTCVSPKRRLADYSKSELEELLEELNALMKEDVEVKYEIKPECTAKIDGISGTFDSKGGFKLGAGVGPVKIGTKGATGVTVEVGHSISAGEGIVGNVSVKVIGEWDTETGEWDAKAELGGKIGLGVAVPEVGGVACYPGGGKVTLNARTFLHKEIMFQRVSEELARR
jgi:hypothetical protein